jgi:chromosomal replication initiator protein
MASIDKKNIWNEVLESIKVSVSDAIFSTWFSQTHLHTLNKVGKRYVAEIGCPSPFIKTTIEGRYFGLIQDSLKKSLESPCDLTFIIKQAPDKTPKKTNPPSPLFQTEKDDKNELVNALVESGIRLGFTFSNYAVSSSNQMAWAAAEAVSKSPGQAYNPLFVWGGVGVGKTHLMNAVGYSIMQDNTGSGIVYCTGEGFTNDIVEGIRSKSTQSFRNKYRKRILPYLQYSRFKWSSNNSYLRQTPNRNFKT